MPALPKRKFYKNNVAENFIINRRNQIGLTEKENFRCKELDFL